MEAICRKHAEEPDSWLMAVCDGLLQSSRQTLSRHTAFDTIFLQPASGSAKRAGMCFLGAEMIYSFGDCELDIGLYELRRDGSRTPVEPQVFDLLKHLIENRDRVVTKEELLDAVWDGRIVSDSTLTSRIKSARRAVGDDGSRQALISTFRGRGFRFIGDVSENDGSSGAVDPIDVGNPFEGSSKGKRPNETATWHNAVRSVAVLPFENKTTEPTEDYFADGTTEEIINLLSIVPGLLVIAHNSTLPYKKQRIDTGKIAEELGVRYILKGTVQKSGKRIRVMASCIDTENGAQIWGNHFDSRLGDIFEVQDEIAGGIVGALQVGLLLAEAAVIKRTPPDALDAWGNLVNAKVKLFAYEREDINKAEPYARRAIEIDPNYGEAYALLCHLLAWRSYNGWCTDPKEVARESLSHAATAMTLSPNNAAVLADVGFARMWIGRPKQCLPFLERSIGLNPNSALACAQYGAALAVNGDPEKGIEYCRQAFRLSPNDPMQYFFQFCLAFALQIQGDHKAARVAAEASLQLNPNICWAYTILASSCVRLGEIDEAKRLIETVTAMSETAVPNLFRAWSDGTNWSVHADPLLKVYDGPLPKRVMAGYKETNKIRRGT